MDMKKSTILISCIILVLAIGGSVTYLSKGSVEITDPSLNTSSVSEEIIVEKTSEESQEESKPGAVDLNTADINALQIAPGIGPSKAQAIIDYRNQYGGFSSVDELIEVKGIGEKTLAKIRDYYVVK